MVIIGSTVLGLVIGSFLNVVIARVPAGESIVSPGSHCPVCDTTLRPVDNLPVLSWLVLRGRCRSCETPISIVYPAVELATAALFGVIGWRVGADPALPALLIAAAAFIALSVIDLRIQRLPDRIVFPALGLTAAALAGAALVDNDLGALLHALAGAAVGFLALGAIHHVRPDGMGFGDVKLAALCGLVLGWFGFGYVVVGLYGSFVLGALIGIAATIATSRDRKFPIPFGPFLAAGTLLTVLALGPLVDRLTSAVGA